MEPVELNEAFLEQLEAACGGRGAILYDEARSRFRFSGQSWGLGLGLRLTIPECGIFGSNRRPCVGSGTILKREEVLQYTYTI